MSSRVAVSSWSCLASLCLAISLFSSPARSEDSLCGVPLGVMPTSLAPRDKNAENLFGQADSIDMRGENTIIFEGTAILQKGTRMLEAERVEFHRDTDYLTGIGNTRFSDSEAGIVIRGSRGDMNLGSEYGIMQDAYYEYSKEHGHGEARDLSIQGPHIMKLQQATYSTCDPGQIDWIIQGTDIVLDKESNQGRAYDVTLEFKSFPILYTPYLSFPLTDKRLTGFLFPSFGSSDASGTVVEIPFYWNIAPHRDATITPRYLSNRGLQMQGEFRYLNPDNNGYIDASYLPDDDAFDNEDRNHLIWQHSGQPRAGWSATVDYRKVSDDNYLIDFGGGIGNSSTTTLNRSADLLYNAESWTARTRVQDYQTLFGTEPYRRMPQVTFETRLPLQSGQLNYQLNSEIVRFDVSDQRVEGDRFSIEPEISWPVIGDAGFFNPKLALRHINYQLNNTKSGEDDSPNLTLPIASLDSGIFLERNTSFRDTPLLQTLEPRLFFLYVPHNNQQDQPVFDSSLYSFSSTTMFLDNRFTGGDRVGDAKQITASLTTRFLHQDTGAELLSANIGQIYYFEDRRVTLPGAAQATDNSSSLVGGITAQPLSSVQFSSTLQWDPHEEQTDLADARLQYKPDQERILNLIYHFRDASSETAQASLAWKFGPRWKILGSYLYDIREDRALESIAGFQYDTCCWALRLVGRHFLEDAVAGKNEYENSIFFELELKGLSSLGQGGDIEKLLKRGILGY